jgi:membrane protease YdiL (CAAX protease family)
MTSFPYEPLPVPPAPRRRISAGVVIAWLVIAACVTILMVRPRWIEHFRPPAKAEVALPAISQVPSTQLEIMGRLALGMKGLAGGAKADTRGLVAQIDAAVRNPIDDFRSIILIDEIEGDEEALKRLKQFEAKYQVVRLREDVDALRTIYTKGANHLTAKQSEMLVERHHWFGELAISHGLPATDPKRQAALRPVGRAMLLGMAAVFGGGALLIAGIVLAILAIVLMVNGRMVFTYRPAARPGPYVQAFALYLAGMVILSLLLLRLIPSAGLWENFLLFALLPLAWLYLRVRGVGWREMMRDLGWHRGRGVLREIGAGAMGYIAGLPLLAIGFVITAILMKLTGNTASHPIVNQPVDSAGNVLQLVLLACVGAPIVEETMFRGALFGHLRGWLGWWIAAPLVSLIFAAIHPQGWVAIPVLGSIALVLAALREWRGSLIACMTAHALNNAVAVLMLVGMAS